MLIRSSLVAATLCIVALAPPPAVAFNCAVPGVFSTAKMTVCATPVLTQLDQAEETGLVTLRGKLGPDAAREIASDRRSFVRTRDGCQRDVRCHEATYTAQSRLYRKLDTCAGQGTKQLICVQRSILRHRQELHRSL